MFDQDVSRQNEARQGLDTSPYNKARRPKNQKDAQIAHSEQTLN